MLAALAADRSRVAQLATHILHLERSLLALHTEKAFLQHRLDAYTYPVATLPNEIVAEIFLHVLPEYPLCAPLAGAFSPTVLTQICRKWRAIAVATPPLWRAIQGVLDTARFERQLGAINTWITRSCACPLSLEIDTQQLSDGYAAKLITAIAPSCARWEHLKLHLALGKGRTLELLDGPMPLLRHLDLQLQDGELAAPIVAFRDAPLLSSVILNADALNITLPWSQLTSLTLLLVYPREGATVLTQTPNLMHCKLTLLTPFGEIDRDLPNISLPRVETMSLVDGGYTVTPINCYLHAFLVPALRRLEISECLLGPDPIDALRLFLAKAGCAVREVDVTAPVLQVAKTAYCTAFPAIRFSFGDDVETEHSVEPENEPDVWVVDVGAEARYLGYEYLT
ncbi:hypothetical protein C8R46DRAFT_1218366 [Mycena filopes]|nr:hypothetical protein C8R46DRAFT_1218366 [Mycena filopes]